MPVFISHRSVDKTLALLVSIRLRQHEIPSYLAEIDPQAATTSKITQLLVERINDCTHLLALITDNTIKGDSWWVPFEIGIARQAPRRIASIDESRSQPLPAYLAEWPVLKGDGAIDEFAAHYHRDDAAQPYLKSHRFGAPTIHSPDDFHRELKRALKQS